MPKRKINAREMVNDVQGGMSDPDLMAKYRVSAKGLESVLRKLVLAGVLTWDEIDDRSPMLQDTVIIEERRTASRFYPEFQVDAFLADGRRTYGAVRDLSEHGLQVSGIATETGEVTTFLIQTDHVPEIDPFIFEAECRWSNPELDGEPVAGFKITYISETAAQRLRKLIRLVMHEAQ